jgi:hypothetical protein
MIGLCLLLLPVSTFAFNGVRSFLSKQALVVSFFDHVSNELLDRPLAIREICNILNHHIDYFYLGCVASSVSYFLIVRASYMYSRLYDLPFYRINYDKFRMFIIFISILFIRDVENAI